MKTKNRNKAIKSTNLESDDLKEKIHLKNDSPQSTQPIVSNALPNGLGLGKGNRKISGWTPNFLNWLELSLLVLAIIVAVRSCTVSQKSLQSSEESSIILKSIEAEVVKKPSLYLAINKIDRDLKGKVTVSFMLLNSGLAEATNVNIKFYIPDSLSPELYIQRANNVKETKDRILISTNDSINKCLKYSYYSDEIVYQKYKHGQPYETKLPFTLSFKLKDPFVKYGGKLSFYYVIQHSKGDTTCTVEYGISNP